MADFNREDFKKALRGNLVGLVATIVCGVFFVAFIILFSMGAAFESNTAMTVALAGGIPFMVIFIAVAAFCNLKYGAIKSRILRKYVQDILVENAALLHPERVSLTYYITIDDNAAAIKINDYKERITLDFNVFGRHAVSRSEIAELITGALTVTYCRLFEKGSKYTDVSYRLSVKEKTKKPVPIILNGAPEKNSYRYYIKNR